MKTLEDILGGYNQLKEMRISGRYVRLEDVLPIIDSYTFPKEKICLGTSEQQESIYGFKFGSGNKRILLWSQMHGNESTTTKALLDFLSLLDKNEAVYQDLTSRYTFFIIPVLNPDGAKSYTRENFNKVDLNRDAVALSQRESRILYGVFKEFLPAFCFNMHDQRTIYTVGDTAKTATVSFLAPAADVQKSITPARKLAMKAIVVMRNALENHIPGHIGRYDDTFNRNCFGDTFQSEGVATVLFEAGHCLDDYQRETTRKHIFTALMSLLMVNEAKLEDTNHFEYFEIPENTINFRDVKIKNVLVNGEKCDVLVQYEERLQDRQIHFLPVVESIGQFPHIFANTTIDVCGKPLVFTNTSKLAIGEILSEFVMDDEIIRI